MADATFKIEKNVPLAADPLARRRMYPFPQMQVGDSFFVPAQPEEIDRKRNSLATGGRSAKGGKFTVRKVDGGLRVWRTA